MKHALYIEVFGMSDRIECDPEEWGSAVVPYANWRHLMDNVRRFVTGDDLAIEVREGVLVFGPIEIKNPKIHEIKAEKSVFDIPFEADRAQMIQHIFSHDAATLKSSGMWGSAEVIAKDITEDIRRSFKHVEKYGVVPNDLLRFVVERLGVANPGALLEAILQDQ